jgi:hypothetical protein
MPGLVPGIHVFLYRFKQDVDGRVKPGHERMTSNEKPRPGGATGRGLQVRAPLRHPDSSCERGLS